MQEQLPRGWVLQRKIGAGAFAEVFAGSGALGDQVAIKMLRVGASEQATVRFQREIKVLRALPASPHIARYYDHGAADSGRLFMVMELVEGYTLGTLVNSGHLLGAREACRLMVQLTQAFGGLHHMGVTHGDVNPDNILITSDGATAKLIDFGLVRDAQGLLRVMERERLLEGAHFEDDLDAGLLLGSPEYMAPEQIEDAFSDPEEARRTDTASDVYGLGVLLHQLLCGLVPYPLTPGPRRGGTYRRRVTAYCQDRMTAFGPVPLGAVPVELEPMLRRALAVEPKERYAEARDFRNALKHFLQHGQVPALEPKQSTIRRSWIPPAVDRHSDVNIELSIPPLPSAEPRLGPGKKQRTLPYILLGAAVAAILIGLVHLIIH